MGDPRQVGLFRGGAAVSELGQDAGQGSQSSPEPEPRERQSDSQRVPSPASRRPASPRASGPSRAARSGSTLPRVDETTPDQPARERPTPPPGQTTWWTRWVGGRSARGKSRSAKTADSRRRAIQRRVSEVGPACIPELLDDLSDEWVVVREAAAAGLGKLRAVEAIGPLSQLVRQDTNLDVRRVAANSLGMIADPAATGPLLDLAEERNRLAPLAIDNVVRLGKAAVPLLLKELGAESELRRQSAIDALGRIGDPAAVRPLLKLAGELTGESRQSLLEALGALGDRTALKTLAAVLEETDVGLVRAGLVGLTKLPAPEAAPQLTKLLTHPLADLRGLAATALAKAGSTRQAPLIAALMEDRQANVRVAALAALRQLGVTNHPRIREALLAGVEDDQAEVREEAAHALGELGLEEGQAGLQRLLLDDYATVRRGAAEALGILANPTSLPTFAEFFCVERDLETRLAGIRAVGRIGDPAGLTVLKPLLNAAEATVRTRTVVAMGELGGKPAVEAILPALRDGHGEVRYHAAVALGQLGDPSVLSALRLLLEDPDPFVLRGLVRALGNFQHPKARSLLESAEANLRLAEEQRRLADKSPGRDAGRPGERGPGWGGLIRALSQPRVWGVIGTSLALLLAVWIFWPRRMETPMTGEAGRGAGRPSARAGDAVVGVGIGVGESGIVVTQGGLVEQWDLATGTLKRTLLDPPEPLSLATVSPSGEWLALHELAGRLRLLQLPEGTTRHTCQLKPGRLLALKFSDDSQRLVALSAAGLVTQINPATGKFEEEGTAEGLKGAVTFCIDGDLRRLALQQPGREVMLQPLVGGRRPTLVPGSPTESVQALAFSRDRKLLAWIESSGTVRVVDLATRQTRQELQGGGTSLRRLQFSADGTRLVAGGAELVAVWDLAGGPVQKLPVGVKVGDREETLGQVDLLFLERQGDRLLGASTHGPHAKLWNLRTLQETAALVAR